MQSLGLITIAAGGTPVQITAADIIVKSVTFQAAPGNAGILYVGLRGMVTASGAGVLRAIPKPVSSTTGPFGDATFTTYDIPGGVNLNLLYIDGTTNDKALVSFQRG